MNHTLKYIIHEVTTKPNNGIAVVNNFSGGREVDFATFSDIKAQGFDSVEAKLSDIISNTRNELTLYLKRKSGSSSVYRKDVAKQIFKAVLKPLNNTNQEVSENTAQASAGNSVDAPVLANNPTTPVIMEQPQQLGLMGGLNQAQVNAFQTYSKADKYEETKESLTTALLNAKSWEEKHTILSDKFKDQTYDIRDLKKELDTLKEKHAEELVKAKKPIVSDDGVRTAEKFAPMFFGLIERFAPAPPAGLAAPAEQPSQPTFSEIKTKLLDTITAVDFTDEHSQLYLNIINKTIFEPETLQQINNLLQPK